eukprot:GHVR01105342.1.p1 GENE.GHVR01105342.1~~GHVR01105342.1.p1  ORF type:complete len:286 (+),score=25.83 GHVR01105342.1:735-1592(+)
MRMSTPSRVKIFTRIFNPKGPPFGMFLNGPSRSGKSSLIEALGIMLGGNEAMRSINLDDMLDNDRGKQALARVVEVPFVAMHDLKAMDQVVGKTMSRVIPDTPVLRSLLTGEGVTTRVLHEMPVDQIASCFIMGGSNEEMCHSLASDPMHCRIVMIQATKSRVVTISSNPNLSEHIGRIWGPAILRIMISSLLSSPSCNSYYRPQSPPFCWKLNVPDPNAFGQEYRWTGDYNDTVEFEEVAAVCGMHDSSRMFAMQIVALGTMARTSRDHRQVVMCGFKRVGGGL